jgi:recombination protein RecA
MSAVNDIVASLKKDFGGANLTTLGEEANFHSKIPYWISTGSTLLDIAIKDGIPGGRIVEIAGKSASGKSCIAYHLMADVQRKGGIAVLLDTEASADIEFAQKCGVDTDNLILAQPDTVEELYRDANLLIEKFKESLEEDIPVLIVADSCTPPTEGEAQKDLAEAPKIAHNAVIQRRGLRKLINSIARSNITFVGINHLVADPMAMFGPKQVSTGGSAWSYFPAVRITLTMIGKIKGKVKGGSIGINIRATVNKSKIGPPDRVAEFPVYFARGIDNVESMVDFGRTNGLFGTTKGWMEFGEKKYRKAEFLAFLREDEEAQAWLLEQCRELIYDVEDVAK